jgi:hypothetical protein
MPIVSRASFLCFISQNYKILEFLVAYALCHVRTTSMVYIAEENGSIADFELRGNSLFI